MQKLLTITLLTWIGLSACQREEQIVSDQEIRFAMKATNLDTHKGGRIQSSNEPKSVLVTILTDDGQTVADRKELTLYKFGNDFLSAPLALKTAGNSNYQLSEFLVLDNDNVIRYVTPKEGSELAHLVNDPLEIDFIVSKDVITTVTPEVLEIDANSNSADYGYGQFGFKIVKTISAVFSSFIKGANNFEFTDSHLKVEGLNITGADTVVLWNYETDLEAKTNTIVIKEAVAYRITGTKEGYPLWKKNISLAKGTKVDILFEKLSGEIDLYVGGSALFNNVQVATYWKNEVPVHIDTDRSSIYNLVTVNNDVYAIGYEEGLDKAFYWKNAEQVMLDHPKYGRVSGISVNGNDVYLSGLLWETPSAPNSLTYYTPVYWKNGELIQLAIEDTEWKWGRTTGIAVVGNDVYISGYLQKLIGQSFLSKPVMWKNGIITELPAASSTGSALGITLEDGHSYSFASLNDADGSSKGYWKDAELTVLKSFSSLSRIYFTGGFQFTVDKSNFYFLSPTYTNRYWKNSEEVVVSPELYRQAELYGMAVINSTVYLAGQYWVKTSDTTSESPAAYWIDGVLHELPIQKSTAYAIHVVQK